MLYVKTPLQQQWFLLEHNHINFYHNTSSLYSGVWYMLVNDVCVCVCFRTVIFIVLLCGCVIYACVLLLVNLLLLKIALKYIKNNSLIPRRVIHTYFNFYFLLSSSYLILLLHYFPRVTLSIPTQWTIEQLSCRVRGGKQVTLPNTRNTLCGNKYPKLPYNSTCDKIYDSCQTKYL